MKKDKNKNLKKGEVDKELKKILDRQERQELLFNADVLLPKKAYDAELEQHYLIRGQAFSLKGIKDLIASYTREYSPMFPNEKPFFKLMYKLLKWDHLDPNSFIKPPVVALYIKLYIYGRFNAEVLPYLQEIENPIMSGHVKKYKLFQFLNDDGIIMLEGFIQDAINVMGTAKSWYDFELKYIKLYGLPVQLKIME